MIVLAKSKKRKKVFTASYTPKTKSPLKKLQSLSDLLLEEEKKAKYHNFKISVWNSLELSLRSGVPEKRFISYHLSAVLVSVVVDLDPDPIGSVTF